METITDSSLAASPLLLDKDLDDFVFFEDHTGDTSQCFQELTTLLDQGKDVNSKNSSGQTILHRG